MIDIEELTKRKKNSVTEIIEMGNKNILEQENKIPTIFVNDIEEAIWPIIRSSIVDRLDIITDLIKMAATRDDMEKSKNEIISHQKKEIGEAKKLINDLIIELESKSIANIVFWISVISLLLISFGFVFSITGGRLILLPIHFIVGAVFCGMILLMSILAKKIYK